jgi:putative oxidoreductase
MLKFLRLDFLPANVDLGLLILRVWLGASMFWLHGMMKLQGFSQMSGQFINFFGIGQKASLCLAIFAEFLCSVLLVLGLFSRLAAFFLAFTMGTAFLLVHKMAFSGPMSGEIAFIYLAGFVTLLISGPGRYSLDGKGKGAKKSKPARSSE